MPHTTWQSRLRTPRRAAGMTLIEATVAILLVAVVVVGAMHTVGAAATSRLTNAQRDRAVMLAESLMAEIVAKPYIDPQFPAVGVIGVNAGETATNRMTFDDVDDYHNWAEAPPVDSANVAIAGAASYRREVQVSWMSPAAPGTTAASDTGLKRIQIVVKHKGDTLFTLTSYRSRTGAVRSES